ncbi:MAG: adenylate cyclase [Pseudomonadales bacterium]|nr:adenylate cyclase [Pseudomonadales bacterium]
MSKVGEVPEPQDEKRDSKLNIPRSEYYFRLLISFVALGTLLPFLKVENPLIAIVNLAFVFWLLYPHVAFVITRRLKKRLGKVVRIFSLSDAIFLGALVSVIELSLLPAILFFTLIQSHALINGGPRHWIEDIAGFFFGLIVMYFAYQPEVHLIGSFSVNMPSLIGVSSYFCIYSFYIYKQLGMIKRESLKVAEDQKALRMKTWKLSRYVSPQVWQTIFSGQDVKLETKRKSLTVFFSDIKGFSEMSEEMEPAELTVLLNSYLSEMSNIIHKYGGTIDKFIGDAIMVFFGDPSSRGSRDDAVACVAMAIEMKRKMKDLQQRWASQGVSRGLEVRMGINSGFCTVGNFGTEQRLDYTLLGTEVNLASRLESNAPPGEILISEHTYSLVKDVIMCRDKGEITVKGFREPVKVFQVVDFRKNLGKEQTFFEQQMDGFTLYVDLEKVKNFDRDKIIKSLLTIATKLKNTVK